MSLRPLNPNAPTAEYQKIEYCIGKDGKVTEKVVNASSSSCIETALEAAHYFNASI